MFRQIGLQFVRASLVEIATLGFHPAWSVSDTGEISEGPPDRPSDSVFPGATALVSGLAGAAPDHTRVQRLSPRRWAFTWPVSDTHAIVAEAHYRDKRDAINDIDTTLVRLVCSASARHTPATDTTPAQTQTQTAVSWPHVERRGRARPSIYAWVALAMPALAALMCAWLALFALPQASQAVAAQQTHIDLFDKAADATMTTGLALALATGDYGQLQDELDRFFKIGYFQSALVVNNKGRVVALAGPVGKTRIGDNVPADFNLQARTLALAVGAQAHGALSLVPPPAAPAAAKLGGAQLAAGLATLACLAVTLMLLYRLRRTRGR